MSSLINLANQLNNAATDTGLGQKFYAIVLKNATAQELEALAEALIGDTTFKSAVKKSLLTLALERETKAA